MRRLRVSALARLAVPRLAVPLLAVPLLAVPLIIACALAAIAMPARADLWGYVDENGDAHFAPEQRDARYRLFFRGPSSLDPAPPVASDRDTAIAALRGTALYERVAASPNVPRFEPLIDREARARGLDPAFVKAVIAVESAFDPAAVSPKGAIGLMQVIPDTAARYGIADDARRTIAQKLLDPATNVRIGTRYLADLMARFADDLTLVLAAYNAGEQAVERHARAVPPYAETQDYVRLVQLFHAVYRPPPPAPPKPSRVTIPHRRDSPATAGR